MFRYLSILGLSLISAALLFVFIDWNESPSPDILVAEVEPIEHLTPLPIPEVGPRYVHLGEGTCVSGADYFRIAQLPGMGASYETDCRQACSELNSCVGYATIPNGHDRRCTLNLRSDLVATFPPLEPPVAAAADLHWGWRSPADWNASGPVSGASVAVNKGWQTWQCYAKTHTVGRVLRPRPPHAHRPKPPRPSTAVIPEVEAWSQRR